MARRKSRRSLELIESLGLAAGGALRAETELRPSQKAAVAAVLKVLPHHCSVPFVAATGTGNGHGATDRRRSVQRAGRPARTGTLGGPPYD